MSYGFSDYEGQCDNSKTEHHCSSQKKSCTVYLVYYTYGSYDDTGHENEKVFFSKEDAKKYIRIRQKENPETWHYKNEYDIQELLLE